MTWMDEPGGDISQVAVKPGEALILRIEGAQKFRSVYPKGWEALHECTEFVNFRRAEKGLQPYLAIMSL